MEDNWFSYPQVPPQNKWVMYYDDQTGKDWIEFGATKEHYTYFKILG